MPWKGSGLPHYPKVLTDFAAPVNVSTETVLMAMQELGDKYEDLRFVVDNQSANRVVALLEHSEDGVGIDSDIIRLDIPAGQQASYEVRDTLRLHWQLNAMGDPDNGYPVSAVRWRLIVKPRST